MKHEEIIWELPTALLSWFPFKEYGEALYIGNKEDALAGKLKEMKLRMTFIEADGTAVNGFHKKHYFDYIIAAQNIEESRHCGQILMACYDLLKPDGRLFLAMNNRFGIRYFCGDRDPYTERSFDGIENYRRAYTKKEDTFRGRMYSQFEIKQMLETAGFHRYQFFSVLPGLENPVFLFAENYLPNEDLANRVFPSYNNPDTVFLEEETLYQGLIENGMFHQMANAYLIECTLDGALSDVCHITSSLERGKENAMYTIIHNSGIVEKKAAYPEGEGKIAELLKNGERLKTHGISVVNAELKDGVYQMPFMKAQTGQLYLKHLLLSDMNMFLEKMDHFRDLILQSSDVISSGMEEGEGAVLKNGFIDMVPLNSFYIDGEFVFYDQEFRVENCPANAIVWRMVATFYAGNLEFHKILPMDQLLVRYGLKRKQKKWQEMEGRFLGELRKENELRLYHEKRRRDYEVVNANRQRMNYSEMEYQRLFGDIFKNADKLKLILFGSGVYTTRFLAMYGRDYPIYAILDNDESKWGQKIEGISIQSPELLRQLAPEDFKVIICIKNYLSVMKQMDSFGVKNYCVYDSGKSYPRRHQIVVQNPADLKMDLKRYHVGYVAGVFDMFHIGHVNLLRRAKEQCDRLIVGVVPDEMVYRLKRKYPIIPCEERAEVLQSCKYADQVEILPADYAGIRDAYKMFHFDCQFSGDDHDDNQDWRADKEYLKKNGADIVFFPYTEKTSTTKIRKRIAKEKETGDA